MKKNFVIAILLVALLFCSCNHEDSNINDWFIIKEFDADISIVSCISENNWVMGKMNNDLCSEMYVVGKDTSASATIYEYKTASEAHTAFQKALFYDMEGSASYVPEMCFFDSSMVRIGNQVVVGMNEAICDMLKELDLIDKATTAKHHGEGNIYPKVIEPKAKLTEKELLDVFSQKGYMLRYIPIDITVLPTAEQRYFICNNDMSELIIMYSCKSASEATECASYYTEACMNTADFSGVYLQQSENIVIVSNSLNVLKTLG